VRSPAEEELSLECNNFYQVVQNFVEESLTKREHWEKAIGVGDFELLLAKRESHTGCDFKSCGSEDDSIAIASRS
jgi:hypothetical protein